jgi:hypothetical protein
VADSRRAHDDATLRRTQRTIAVVRAAFAILAAAAIAGVLVAGEHNHDEYEVLGTDVTVELWQVLAGVIAVLAIVLIGAVAELGRASRRRHFES